VVFSDGQVLGKTNENQTKFFLPTNLLALDLLRFFRIAKLARQMKPKKKFFLRICWRQTCCGFFRMADLLARQMKTKKSSSCEFVGGGLVVVFSDVRFVGETNENQKKVLPANLLAANLLWIFRMANLLARQMKTKKSSSCEFVGGKLVVGFSDGQFVGETNENQTKFFRLILPQVVQMGQKRKGRVSFVRQSGANNNKKTTTTKLVYLALRQVTQMGHKRNGQVETGHK